MSESTDIDLLHRVWEAMSRGDLSVLEVHTGTVQS